MSDVIVDVDTYVSEMVGVRDDVIGPVTSFPDGDTGDKLVMPTTSLAVLVTRDTPDSTESVGETVGKRYSKYCWGGSLPVAGGRGESDYPPAYRRRRPGVLRPPVVFLPIYHIIYMIYL